ncbi:ankyrin repeat-containing domain protein [Diaporthe amygdali]|uniref:ankyrin repeat-containing domain protein n=1 Tax=Phomopsis amygdali TaxID=1214568 RepID=UPI0022FF084C|nr:ankyrin repeat-containing domain protein [Diaporthe amygdali]KAJ0125453.1 ankyrin repeat-containing domain protein [Diaporthe amygdali]
MESTTVGGDETYSKWRLKILASTNDEHSLYLAVENGQLSSFSSLLRQGIPMTARVISLMFKSWTNQGSEFCEAWLREGGSLNGFFDDSTPLNDKLFAFDTATTSATEIDEGNFQPVPSRVEILKILLDHGADANEMEVDPKALGRPRASYTGTPLHRAVRFGSLVRLDRDEDCPNVLAAGHD